MQRYCHLYCITAFAEKRTSSSYDLAVFVKIDFDKFFSKVGVA